MDKIRFRLEVDDLMARLAGDMDEVIELIQRPCDPRPSPSPAAREASLEPTRIGDPPTSDPALQSSLA